MVRNLTGKLCVSGTVVLISFLGFSSQLFVVLPTLHTSREALRLLVPFNLLLLLLFWNYTLTVRTDPGRVPKGWEPDLGAQGEYEVKRESGGPRHCRTCKAYKPPRAHHCRKCGRCVLKMDHHCPWVNNCVGHHDYAHFVRFLFFVDLSCAYHLWLITTTTFNPRTYMTEPTPRQIVFLVLNYVGCIPVLFAVGCFSIYHFWCIAANTTTIEAWEKEKVARLKRKGKIREYKYPYHLGLVGNMRAVLGDSLLLACWPRAAPGEGLSYPVGQGVDPAAGLDWPPVDQFRERARAPSRLKASRARAEQVWTSGSLLATDPRVVSPGAENSALRQRGVGQTLISRGEMPRLRNAAPYAAEVAHLDREEERDGDYEMSEEEESEDDRPLGSLITRRAHPLAEHSSGEEEGKGESQPKQSVRVRRGSEGYEVRPKLRAPPSTWAHELSESEEEEEAYYIDEEGDRRRVGPRYKYYQPEPASSDEYSESDQSSG